MKKTKMLLLGGVVAALAVSLSACGASAATPEQKASTASDLEKRLVVATVQLPDGSKAYCVQDTYNYGSLSCLRAQAQ